MPKARALPAALVIAIVAASSLTASDRVAVYAKVDRVVLEPSADAPERVQVWGVFSVAVRDDPNSYRPAARGYLYYKLPSKPEAARREWNDLKQIAGSGQIVAFGNRWEGTPKVRSETERPDNPEVYAINTGVTKIAGNTDYAPVRAIVEFR